MINIEWINGKKTSFQIKSIDKTLFTCLDSLNTNNCNNYNDVSDIRNLLCCEAKYCPLNAQSFWRKLPYYILWPTNNFIIIDILFGGGLLNRI